MFSPKVSKIIIINILAISSGMFLIFTPRGCFFRDNVEQEIFSHNAEQEEEDPEEEQDALSLYLQL